MPSVYSLRLRNNNIPIEVVDLFCGVGGLSYGLKRMGFKILDGYDFDASCEFAYEKNTKARFHHRDIKTVRADEIEDCYSQGAIRVLAGCAPCQPFSSNSNNKRKDPDKYDLLYEFGRLIQEIHPDIVTMENVINIASFKMKPVFQDFLQCLADNGYYYHYYKVFCPDYGIPQTRKRMVLVASSLGEIQLLPKSTPKNKYKTVRDTISSLPPLTAGESDNRDPLHRARTLTPINMRRILATPEGGSWHDWPDELRLECHKSSQGQTFGSVYGRMKWDEPSPTITTECTGLGNGRFGHPDQDRAISLREAAMLQTFPRTYKFFPNEESVSFAKASRYIGNAVPPALGMVIGGSIIQHLRGLNIVQ